MTDAAFKLVSVEDYLRAERDSPTRHEYIDGFVYAQAGASRAHNIITSNLHVALHGPARRAGCQVFQSDMKVRVTPTRYHYPDLVVSCGPPGEDEYTETAPCLIVEVLSESTRAADQNYKAERYRELPSLQAYLMVDSARRAAALYRRTPEGWVFEVVAERIQLPCPPVELMLELIYEGVTF
ncbi:Uma2 family endonuclease [Deinococcus arcticus]|uniref:Putative restriction endonuclease domain-containing protein n=1 Tax=Deinococcus arcticus TaxID=2136176 RepID=A0A2T3W535_9DEIO|nr:Uma2 family endonuclease [Deinococcus arcticus]PTA67001.1 hypothetical protein C8263_14915 [Deinococcus arcticus]